MELLIPNVALNGEATQSSNYFPMDGADINFNDPHEARYATDGKFGTDIDSGDSCAHTRYEFGAWRQVDLKYRFEIKQECIPVGCVPADR